MSKKNISNEELEQASGGAHPATVIKVGDDFVTYQYKVGGEKRQQQMGANEMSALNALGLKKEDPITLGNKRVSLTFRSAEFHTGSSWVI
jgi:hypothetical protein